MRHFAILIGFFLLTGFCHKFYVSISEVNHNAENASLEISMKIFTDDLEDALEVGTSKKIWLGDPKREVPETDSLLANYLERKLTFTVNGEAQTPLFIGKELEADVTWCYLEIKGVTNLKSIAIDNRLFLDLFDEQKNLIHIYANDKEKSLFLRRGKSSGEVTY